MKILRGLISILFSIIFALFILFVALIGILNSSISKKYILSKFDEANIYNDLSEMVNSEAQKFVETNGDNKEIIEKFTTEENIEELITYFVDNMYDNKNFDTSNEGFQKMLNDNIEEIADNYNIKLTEEQKIELGIMIEELADDYDSVVNIDSNLETMNSLPIFTQSINYMFYVVCVLALIFGVIILLLNYDNIFTGVKFIASGILTSGIFLMFCHFFVKNIVLTDRFNYNFDSENEIFDNICRDLAQKFSNLGTIYLLTGIILVFLTILINIFIKKAKKQPVQSSYENSPTETDVSPIIEKNTKKN